MDIKRRIQDWKPQPGSLKARAMVTASWSVTSMGLSSAMRLMGNLLLTQVLNPEAYGLMAVIVTLHIALGLFSDIGILQSVVRTDYADEKHFLRVAWTVQILRHSVIALIFVLVGALLYVFQDAIAPENTVYADPLLPGLIAATSLVPFLIGLNSANTHLTTRNLDIGRLTMIGLGSQAISLALMLILAYINPTVWVLFAGMVSQHLLVTIGTHMFLRGPTMWYAWDSKIAWELWRFGKWIMASSIGAFVSQQSDKIILAAVLDAKTFGVYTIARIWLDTVKGAAGRLQGQIGLASLSEIKRDRPHDYPRIFNSLREILTAISVGLFFFLFITSETIIQFLYRDVYHDAGFMLGILAFSLLALRYTVVTQHLVNIGDSRTTFIIATTIAVTLIACLPFAYEWFGLTGVLIVIAFSGFAPLPIILWHGYKAAAEYKTRFFTQEIILSTLTLVMLIIAINMQGGT